MDGETRTYLDDDMPILFSDLLAAVSQCRGRPGLRETLSKESFTAEQLDAAAPLTKKDLLSLQTGNPSARAKEKYRRRLETARRLKYGGSADG